MENTESGTAAYEEFQRSVDGLRRITCSLLARTRANIDSSVALLAKHWTKSVLARDFNLGEGANYFPKGKGLKAYTY